MVREDIAGVRQRDPVARNTLYPGVHAIIWHWLAHRLWIANHKFLARAVSFAARFLTNVDTHPGAAIGERFFIDHGAGVVIGETAVVGDDVTLYHGVSLGWAFWSPGKRHPTVEDSALIGAGAKVLGNITIGRENAHRGQLGYLRGRRAEDDGRWHSWTPCAQSEKTVGPGGRIDLEHHLIRDPVADAMAILIDRIGFLEPRLSHLHQRVGAGLPDKAHEQICEEDQTS